MSREYLCMKQGIWSKKVGFFLVLLFVFSALLPMALGALNDTAANQVAYWTMDEGSSTLVDIANSYDLSAVNTNVNNSGIILNATNYPSASSAHATIASNPDLSLVGADYTHNFWVYWNSFTGLRVFNKDDGTGFTGGYGYYIAGGTLRWAHNSGTSNTVDTGWAPSSNTWYMVTAIYDNATNYRHLFVDGVEVYNVSTKAAVSASASFNLTFAARSNFNDQNNNIVLDEVSFWNTSLTYNDVADLYNSGSPTTAQRYPYTFVSPTYNSFSVPQAVHKDSTTPISIGNTYGTVDSFTYTNTNTTSFYVASQIQTNGGTGTAECRINVNGSYYNSTAQRSLSAGTTGNLYLLTEDISGTENTNYTTSIECRKIGGTNYLVENSAIDIIALYDAVGKKELNSNHFNTTGLSVNTTEATLATTNFTTGLYNNSGTNNLTWVLDGRASIVYGATSNVNYYVNISDGTKSQTIQRYGTIGSTGSTGNIFTSLTGLAENTTYTVTLRGSTSTGTSTINNFNMHMYELTTHPSAVNSSTASQISLVGGTDTLIDSINITNLVGGNYNVEIKASINAYNLNTTQDAYFYISNAVNSTNVTRTLPTLAAGQNGNIVLLHEFSESGVGSQQYSLYGRCPNDGCVINSSELVGFVVDNEAVSDLEFTVYAYDFYNNSQLSGFNVTIGGSTFTATGNNVTVPYNTNPETISVSKNNYFINTTIHDTTTTLNASLTPYTAIRAFSFDSSVISNFSILFNNNTYTITNGLVYVPAQNNNYTVVISNAFNGTTYFESANTTLIANPYVSSYNFTLYYTNSFIFFFRNETTNQQLTSNVTVLLISGDFAANYTAENGAINITLLVSADYTIRYWEDPDVPRDYYVTLTNQSVQNITLYTIDAADSDIYLPVESDENDNACSDNTVSLLRYYIDINGYRVVEMAKTDTNGQAVLFVQPNIINYKLLFSGSCGTFTTAPQKIVSSTNGFTVVGAQSFLTSSEAVNNATVSLDLINNTRTYVFTWADSSNIVTSGCLYVYKTTLGVKTTNYTACTNSATGSLIFTLTGNVTNNIYTAKGVLSTNTEFSTYSFTGPIADFTQRLAVWAGTGVFWGLITVLGVVMISLQSAVAVVIASIGTLAVLAFFGILGLGTGAISWVVGLIIIGGILIYKMSD